MRSYDHQGYRAGGSCYSGCSPAAPASPYHQPDYQDPRQCNLEASDSKSCHRQQALGPLSPPTQHFLAESDEYEERGLGEIAAAYQAAQDQRWGPHAAPSEAPARFERWPDQRPHFERHFSVPATPHSFEPLDYDGGFYMEPHTSGAFFPPRGTFGYGTPSKASGQTLSGRSHQSLPVYTFAHTHTSASSPASEPPSIFNVNAAHHLPGTGPHPQDAFGGGSARIGDSLPGFPNWSQTWYGGHLSADGHAYTMVPPGSGQSGWESESFGHGPYGLSAANPCGQYPYSRTVTNDRVKEERMRTLERQFGPKASHREKCDVADDQEQEPEEDPIGGLDEKGRLVLPRHKIRVVTRWLQCLISLGAAGMGIGGFILIRPASKAPPSGSLPSFVLYGVSVVSTIVCLWLFALKPCCRSGRGRSGAHAMSGALPNGIVIPVMTAGGAPGGKAGIFGKKGKTQPAPCVNIIVDPTLLGNRIAESDSDTDDDATIPGEARRKKRSARKRRQSDVLANMKHQARWREARASLKWDCGWDIVLCLLWGSAAVMALVFGKKCPAGTGEGWCNLYNGAIACAIVASLLFLVAVFCDVIGLRAAKTPPTSRA